MVPWPYPPGCIGHVRIPLGRARDAVRALGLAQNVNENGEGQVRLSRVKTAKNGEGQVRLSRVSRVSLFEDEGLEIPLR
jgi:hypothetical protein